MAAKIHWADMISSALTGCGVIKLLMCFQTAVTLPRLIMAQIENLSVEFIDLWYLWSYFGGSRKLVNSIWDINLSFQKPI